MINDNYERIYYDRICHILSFSELPIELRKILKKTWEYLKRIGYDGETDGHILSVIKELYYMLNKPGKFELFFNIEDVAFEIRKRREIIKDLSVYCSINMDKEIAGMLFEFLMCNLNKSKKTCI